MTIHDVLNSPAPVILMLTHGETVAADVSKALETAQRDGLTVVKINVDEQPEYAKQFEVGKHPVMVAWHGGEVIARRSRPWGTDANEIVNNVRRLVSTTTGADGKAQENADATDAPIHVTDQTFAEKVLQSKLPVLVDFWAEWCGPCRMVAPILDKLAKEFAGKVRIAKVDVDHNPILARQFQIHSIPTMMFIKNGKIVGQSAGAAPEGAIRDALNQLIALQV